MIGSNDLKYCVSIDGSVFSEFALDFTIDELMNDSSDKKIIATHIKIANQDNLPFKMQSKSIHSYIESKLIGNFNRDKYFIQIFEEDKKQVHAIAQIYESCLKFNYDYMIVGFQGTSKNEKNEITHGIMYILTSVHLPCFIIKEYIPRNQKKNKAYVWLACIDHHHSRGWKAFTSACSFIKENDTVIITHFSNNSKETELIEKEFHSLNEKLKIKHFKTNFQELDSKKTIGQQIVEIVNYSEITPDFVILGHNTTKYSSDNVQSSPAVEVMKKAYTNILFHS